MSTHEALLAQYKPVLKYDSQETYFADSAAEWTDCPGNRLVRKDGTVVAEARRGLNLGFLGTSYRGAGDATKDDAISDPSPAYREQARALHQQPAYGNHVYGHAVEDGDGGLWLQYWFFYFYNDYNLIGTILKAGLHEGDWEMVQIRLRDEKPDRAVFAQHAGAGGRDWKEVDVVPGTSRPIVYVARGSHASYFAPGTHWTGHWFDYADGKRRSPELTLEVVTGDEDPWRWVRWPGAWGDTRKSGVNPLDSDSPPGPGCHGQWDHPLVLERKAAPALQRGPAEPRPVPPPPPAASAQWADGSIVVRYEALPSGSGAAPMGIVVTVNSPDEPAPPTTQAFPIEASKGEVRLTVEADPAHRHELYVSSASEDGLASESVRMMVPPAGGTAAS